MAEQSRALPSYMYGDPAKVAEENELRELGCMICTKRGMTLMRSFCSEPRNDQQKGFPRIGHRCRWFDERIEVNT